jgi:hypothetical protein
MAYESPYQRAYDDGYDAGRGSTAAELDRLTHEVESQCLLNAKGAQRESDLIGKVGRLEREVEAWRKVRRLADEISDPDLRGIVTTFLDRFGITLAPAAQGTAKPCTCPSGGAWADLNQAHLPDCPRGNTDTQPAAQGTERKVCDCVYPHPAKYVPDYCGICHGTITDTQGAAP